MQLKKTREWVLNQIEVNTLRKNHQLYRSFFFSPAGLAFFEDPLLRNRAISLNAQIMNLFDPSYEAIYRFSTLLQNPSPEVVQSVLSWVARTQVREDPTMDKNILKILTSSLHHRDEHIREQILNQLEKIVESRSVLLPSSALFALEDSEDERTLQLAKKWRGKISKDVLFNPCLNFSRL